MRVGNCNLSDDNSNFGTILATLYIYSRSWFSMRCDYNRATGNHSGRLGPGEIKTDSAVFSLYVHYRSLPRNGWQILTRQHPPETNHFAALTHRRVA